MNHSPRVGHADQRERHVGASQVAQALSDGPGVAGRPGGAAAQRRQNCGVSSTRMLSNSMRPSSMPALSTQVCTSVRPP